MAFFVLGLMMVGETMAMRPVVPASFVRISWSTFFILGLLAFDGEVLQAATVVEAQHGGLGAGRKAALGDGRLGVAFQLNGPAVAGFHQHGVVVEPVK